MNSVHHEQEGLPPFVPNWFLGTAFLSLATAVGMGIYCQMPSAEDQKEATKKQVAEILAPPTKNN